MSLIRVRHSRKKNWVGPRKGMPPSKLLLLFVFVAALIWYLGRF